MTSMTSYFPYNCINFKFSLDVWRRKSFIFWSSIRWTHSVQTLVINKIRARSSLLDQCLCPLCQLSDAHWLDDFAEQVSTARQFFSQAASDGCLELTGVHLQSFFCLDRTRQPSVLLWHITAHLHSIQQSFGCVSAVAKRSPVSKTFHCTIANSVKISHSVWPAIFNKLYITNKTCRWHPAFKEH